MDGHIILPLEGFDPVDCGRMRCDQSRTTILLLTKRDGEEQSERQTQRKRDRETYSYIILTGHHWGPSDPNVGINALRCWPPTLEINTTNKIANSCGRPSG